MMTYEYINTQYLLNIYNMI